MKQDPFALCPARVEMRVGLNMDNIALLQDKCKEHCFTIKTISDNSYCIQNQKENKVFCCNFFILAGCRGGQPGCLDDY